MFPHGLEGIWLSMGFPPRGTLERRLWAGEHDQKQKPTVEDGQTSQGHQILLIKKEENKVVSQKKGQGDVEPLPASSILAAGDPEDRALALLLSFESHISGLLGIKAHSKKPP